MTTTTRSFLRRPVARVALGVFAALLVVGLALFEPWDLFIDHRVAEPVPAVAPAAPDAQGAPAAPVVLARGELISHEHATTGSVQVLALPDGSRVLRLQDLQTTNGPLLKVFLTDAPVLPGTDGWSVFDDGSYVDLGELKGNIGSSNYPLPADVDLSRLTSVSVWCDRFNVSFGAAQLAPAGG
jgi:hypothetical protein